jgi:hypothetical protein
MFGTFTDSFLTDGGERIAFSGVTGFAEHAINHW